MARLLRETGRSANGLFQALRCHLELKLKLKLNQFEKCEVALSLLLRADEDAFLSHNFGQFQQFCCCYF